MRGGEDGKGKGWSKIPTAVEVDISALERREMTSRLCANASPVLAVQHTDTGKTDELAGAMPQVART